LASDKKRISDWVYLAASAAVSYYLISKERGEEKHWDIVAAHNAVKVMRRVRAAIARLEFRLQGYVDTQLDKERTV